MSFFLFFLCALFFAFGPWFGLFLIRSYVRRSLNQKDAENPREGAQPTRRGARNWIVKA